MPVPSPVEGRNRPTKRPGLPAPPREERPPLPEFAPVPRKYRHDGWTPERQKAFIEALADTGCVTRAAAAVNMAQANCYTLRRAAGAEGFRRAWDAALDLGVKRLKDIAFERAIEGHLVPVFVAGKLMGFRRKRNDALLMFILRHYGQDGQGKRTTINYFSSRASSGASAGTSSGPSTGSGRTVVGGEDAALHSARPERIGSEAGAEPLRRAAAEASATTVRTVISGRAGANGGAEADDAAAAVLNGFEGVELDGEAQAAIMAALEACAARARAADAAYEAGGEASREAQADDPDEPFVREPPGSFAWRGELIPPVTVELEDYAERAEPHWRFAGAELPAWLSGDGSEGEAPEGPGGAGASG